MEFTRGRVLCCALIFRCCLIGYSIIHDYIFTVRFTDIDYSVYHDAAIAMVEGGSPYQRATYRYSPLLAWLLLPNAVFSAFGKLLFCSADILVGWMCLRLGDERRRRWRETNEEGDSILRHCLLFWLANPLTMIISARGNADSLVVAAVIATLLLIEKGKWYTAAVVHGALGVQLKLYPILLLVPVYLHSIQRETHSSLTHILNLRQGDRSMWERVKMLSNTRGLLYALITIVSFAGTQAIFYALYGDKFLYESLIYHFKRIDIRHNFSIYFYPLYLAEGNEWITTLISKGAFIPQLVCLLLFSTRYSADLAFSSFLSLYSFVALNKVCTSQYFVWYISFLPVIASRIEMSHSESSLLIGLWWLGQGLWLFPAYLFEFRGISSFEFIWIASLVFFSINMYIISRLCRSYREGVEVEKTKKSQ
ncbi:hypothetical protein PMAYCL1PPCAC_06703 [Pristionchus mayeri]|uniref:GPI alpha-1,4-mannosyltransferase I, catalytic subunit n=1 Tax=Pristionchus mayeri TaxID=1317129 RepID=A0AAN4ZDH1_9BILA|nr:hypothetical protein PMAYCL1PPCAC_06703 [Pristionchus mayeri]